MPTFIKLVGENEEEELFYRKHIFDALGEEEGEQYLRSVDKTREMFGELPAMVNAQLKDIMKK